MATVASALFNRMQAELEVLYGEYTSLSREFAKRGGFEIFVGLDEKLTRLSDRAYGLNNAEERLEIQHGVNAIQNEIKQLLHP